MIRLAIESDLPEILEIYGPYILNTTASFEYTVPTLEEFTARFRGITEQFPWLVWEEDGRILGHAYASHPFHRAAYRWCAESSIYLRPEARGKGIGKRLQLTLEEVLRQQGYAVVYAVITSENEGSLAFHRALALNLADGLGSPGWKNGCFPAVFPVTSRFRAAVL